MKHVLQAVTCLLVSGILSAQGSSAETIVDVTADVNSKIAKIGSFSAVVETGEEAEGDPGAKVASELLVSRDFGWKLSKDSGTDAFTFVTDFKTFYQYFPTDKKVIKVAVDNPEISAMIRKPVTDMNPINLLSPASLTYLGKESVDGETVYQVKGTTESQLMPGGPKVLRTLTVWIGVEDGLPRKTIESVGMSTGTTTYKNVVVNPPVSAEKFSFTPPEGVMVIDPGQQMKSPTRPAAIKP